MELAAAKREGDARHELLCQQLNAVRDGGAPPPAAAASDFLAQLRAAIGTGAAAPMQVEQPVMGTDVDVVARNPRHWVDFCADADHCADALVQALKRRLPTEAGDAQDGARFAVDVVGLLLQQAPLEAVLRKLDDSISFWQLRASCGRSGAVAFRDKVWTADVVPKDRQAAVAAAHAAGRGAKSGHGGGRAGQAYGGGNGGGQAAQPYAPGNGGGRGRGGGGHWRGGQRK